MKKKRYVVGLIIIAILLVVGMTFAYWIFTYQQKGVNQIISNCLKLELINEKNDIDMKNTYPLSETAGSETAPYEFSIKNNCTNETSYSIVLEVLNSTTLSTEYVRSKINEEESEILNARIGAKKTISNAKESWILLDDTIGGNDTKDYKLRLWLDANTPMNDNTMNQTFQGKIVVNARLGDEEEEPIYQKGTLAYKILENEFSNGADLTRLNIDVKKYQQTIKDKGEPTFSEAATTDEGLYETDDDLGKSYYFRGNVQDNWVHFANLYWRIIRINGDGTVRMIYNGSTTDQTGETTQVTTKAFNEQFDNPKYVGYMWGDFNEDTQTYANDNNSTIKDYLENEWFDGALGEFTDYLADEIFCNDRTITGGDGVSTNISTYYGLYKKIYKDKKPDLKCPQANDRFAIGTNVGNIDTNEQITDGKSIGLITADEVMMAGANVSDVNSSFYLNTGQEYWTMSPSAFSSGYAIVWHVSSDGYLNYNRVPNKYGVRPVINLKADVKIASGNGTADAPYEIDTSGKGA